MDSSSSSSFSQYPHPSMINVGNFVSVKLTTANYLMWEAQMLSLILSQNLQGFIDGQNEAPPQNITVQPHDGSELNAEIENPEYQAWTRTDWLLKGWIIGSLSEEVLGLVVMSDWKSDTARVVWDRLAIAFAPHSDQKPKPEIQSQTVEKTKTEGQGFEFRTEQKTKLEELLDELRSEQRFSVMKNLVESMSKQELAFQVERTGFTALHEIAVVGSVQIAKLLVKKAPLLPNIKTSEGSLPLHVAAGCRHREMTSYLMEVAKDEKKTKPFEGQSGVALMSAVLEAKFYGVSVKLEDLPNHLSEGDMEDLPNHPGGGDMEKGVQIIKGKVMLGAMGAGLDGLEDESVNRVNNGEEYDELDMISSSKEEVAKNNWISNDMKANSNVESFVEESLDLLRIENISMRNMKEQVEINPTIVFQNLHGVVWKALEILVPWIKDIRHTKLMHREALQLMKYLCNQVKKEDVILLALPLLFGAQHGIHEVVEEVIKEISNFGMGKKTFEFVNKEKQNAFHLAVMYHREKVFKILYQYVQYLPTSVQKIGFSGLRDQNGNIVLHLAGNMARQDRLDLVSGGVLQMQRDLQWFKVINFFSVSEKVT
ncbi:hypothetical protein F0562_023637 [Nyssa sinensis]|uniref:Retrotransposon Copia-like N-terminal domain-containing protein n=1 Tax=Nyssa sinensis TaxID=561372 RepID=A0A5J5BJQ6_9ASTE|nr:hypothetical protein F0562_023637 [Nyssa sinensis]